MDIPGGLFPSLALTLLAMSVRAQVDQGRSTGIQPLDRPGQPTVDMTHVKQVWAKCYNPTTSTSPTSPVFDMYLADLGATFNGATPIGLQADCRRDMQNGGVAVCAFTFDPNDYNRAAVTNMDGRPKLKFVSCSIQLDGGSVVSSNTCWTDAASTAQPTVLRSGIAETDLGPVTFSINLQDNNAATGGTYVGPISAVLKCTYYTQTPFVGSVAVHNRE